MRDDNKEYRKLFVGVDSILTRDTGEQFIPINFDNAATTPPFKLAKENINKYMETYASIGRGSGIKSVETTAVYEQSREVVLNFFSADENEYTVIYVKNTTEGLNLLANALIENDSEKIVSTRMEHLANDLPWRGVGDVIYLEVDKSGELILDNLEDILKNNNVKVITLTAASNVTGVENDIYSVAKLAHKYGALIVVDAAQIVAHSKIEIAKENGEYLDFIVFSGHKMYAPFGSGAIVGRKDIIKDKSVFISGGGAVDLVFDNSIVWGDVPWKYEAGTPNFLGIVGIVSSILQFNEIGMENINIYETELKKYLFDEIKKINGLIEYANCDISKRLALISINLEDKPHSFVASELSRIREIAVRSGGFCAHSYVRRLLNLSDIEMEKYLNQNIADRPGLVRISLGLYNSFYEIDEFLETLEKIASTKKTISY